MFEVFAIQYPYFLLISLQSLYLLHISPNMSAQYPSEFLTLSFQCTLDISNSPLVIFLHSAINLFYLFLKMFYLIASFYTLFPLFLFTFTTILSDHFPHILLYLTNLECLYCCQSIYHFFPQSIHNHPLFPEPLFQ